VRTRHEDGRELPLLVWQFDEPLCVASTASAGGGLGLRQWVINAQVGHDYSRHDQRAHATELAAAMQLSGDGVVMFTATDVRWVWQAVDGDVEVHTTVGLTHPTWAADTDEVPTATGPGTINIVAVVPVRLGEAALLNALCTVTEAKVQALLAARIDGTGTPSDAVTIVCPADGPREPFAGPRSTWGARLARAVHRAVVDGASGPNAQVT
jgi:adenosylcobinamide hydrolase